MITNEMIAAKYDFKLLELKGRFLRLLSPLISSGGAWVYGIDHKIRRVVNGMEHNTPWVFVRRSDEINCQRNHRILFECYEIIPRQCMSCYKVVVRPRTIVELFKLHEVMMKYIHEDISCKCGVEERTYVNAQYGGYLYTQGIERGKDVYEITRKAVSEHISPDIPVMLKRACTEFKEMYGESDKWDEIQGTKTTGFARDMWDAIEDWVDYKFEFESCNPPQPDDIKQFVMEGWVNFAYAVGDKSYKVLTGGNDLKVKDSTY